MEPSDIDSPPAGNTWRDLRGLVGARPDATLTESERAACALLESFELFERGVRMMRMNLRREDPVATEEELVHRLRVWLRERTGAPHGDGVGRPAPERLRRILDGVA